MLRTLLALLLSLFLTAAGLEVFLRVLHGRIFPMAIRNELATGYHGGFTGIYRWHPETNTYRMRPDFTRSMEYNGYGWLHHTDGQGLRHPREIESAPVVLLGDSMIYGHGVEQEDTVREQLERRLGVPVANLGMQGASMHEEFQLLREPGLRLSPRVAIVFFLYNDPTDLLARLSRDEMVALLANPPEDLDAPYFERRERTPTQALDEWSSGFFTVRALRILEQLVVRTWEERGRAHAARDNAWGEEENLALGAHNALLRRTQRLARANDVLLLHVFIETGQRPHRERRLERVLRRVTTAEGIPFLSLRAALDAARRDGIEPFLPHDGHFSPEGARVVADAVVAWLDELDLTTPLREASTSEPTNLGIDPREETSAP